MSFTDTRLTTIKCVNGSIVTGYAALSSSTTSGAIAHGLAMVQSVSFTPLTSSTGYEAYWNDTPPTGDSVILVGTTGVTYSYMIVGY